MVQARCVPGRLNEKALTITKPGVYFGQCSELCGARHGFMPISVEALPPAQFAAWVKAQGGAMPGANKPLPAAIAPKGESVAEPTAPAGTATDINNAAPAAVPTK